jgi:hypothetical protein
VKLTTHSHPMPSRSRKGTVLSHCLLLVKADPSSRQICNDCQTLKPSVLECYA